MSETTFLKVHTPIFSNGRRGGKEPRGGGLHLWHPTLMVSTCSLYNHQRNFLQSPAQQQQPAGPCYPNMQLTALPPNPFSVLDKSQKAATGRLREDGTTCRCSGADIEHTTHSRKATMEKWPLGMSAKKGSLVTETEWTPSTNFLDFENRQAPHMRLWIWDKKKA